MASLFDGIPGHNGDEGDDAPHLSRTDVIGELKAAILRIAADKGQVSADDVRYAVPIPPHINPVVTGCAFRELSEKGKLRPFDNRNSTRRAAHSRTLKVWQLAPGNAGSNAVHQFAP